MDAIAYLRRSSAPNAGTRTVSFEMQEAAVRDLAARNGDVIDSLVTDWAKSGGDSKRPGYRQLLAAIDAGSVKTIYSFSLSRLSRSLLDFVDLLDRCRQHGVRVRLVQEGDIDWRSATGRAFAGMAAVFAQMERELAAERIQSAVDARRARGDHLGQAPYGLRVVDGKLVRRDDEDPSIVLETFREAGSFGRTARLLNERGVPTRRNGTGWNHGTVADIIRRQYPHEAPKALTRARAKPRSDRLLAGLLTCPCGAILTPRSFRGVLTYYCSRSYRVPGHGKTTIPEAAILPLIKEEAARLRAPDRVELVEASEAALSAIEARRDRLTDALEAGVLERDRYAARMAVLDEEAAAVETQRSIEHLPERIEWGSDLPAAVNAVLRAMWSRVRLGPDLLPRPWPDGFAWRVPQWRAP